MSRDEAIAALEARVRQLEDRLEIFQLMATYGPSADSGSGDVVESLFTTNAVYDSGPIVCEGAAGVRDMIEAMPLHRSLMDGGCAHLITMPLVKVDGDRAVAICHSQIVNHQDDGFGIFVTSATVWDLERTPSGWKIARRVNRPLNGTEAARKHFRDALLDQAV